ncbi:hypothetical protein ACFZDJ_41090 [Streptomyces sp. NPDC007896]|uniref:hypothetical protein n=1 Tax=Streptomyces sp. NPDC007896 TaxID=3364784 RepID=UPI0036E9E062
MKEHPGFGAMLAWSLDHRDLGVQELADRAGLTADEVRAVLAGERPGAGLLRRLAPALGFHAVDLFILAGLAVPDDLAPLDGTATKWVASTVTDATRLPAAGRRDLLQQIRLLPQEERRSSFAPKPLIPLAGGPSTWVIRMLQYRNLNWMGMAQTLAFVTPTYLSAATYGVIGSGRKELTPRLVTDFAVLLGIDASDLAALTGVFLREVPPSPSPEAVDAAALLWEARRLSAVQARHVAELARALRDNSRAR